MTAWPIPAERATEAGASFLLRKPFELDDPVYTVRRELASTPGHERQIQQIKQFFAALNEHNWQQLTLLCTPDVMIVPVSAPARAG